MTPKGAPRFLLTAELDEAVRATHGNIASPADAPRQPADEVVKEMQRLFVVQDGEVGGHLADAFYDDDVLSLPPPSFVVDGWVAHGSFTVFWGKPGTFKTFLLNEMQRCVRRGAPWMTHPVRQGMTVMYQGEGLEQLQPRINAWNQRNPQARSETTLPGVHFDRQPNLGTPEGCATVVHTVRAFEKRHGKRVQLLIFDPLVEFMPANDRIEDMDPVSRGLRALAQHLGCAVVVGHHSNAEGGRARGTDHLYMRCGAYVQMEALDGGRIGVVQHKIKNTGRMAMVVKPEPYGESVVLEFAEGMLAEDYQTERSGDRKRKTEGGKVAVAEQRRDKAEALLLAVLRKEPGKAKDALVKACLGHDVGKSALEQALAALVEDGRVRVEDAARNAKKHYVVEP